MDIVPKHIIIGCLILGVTLILLLNYGLKHNHKDENARRFNLSLVEGLISPHVTLAHKTGVEDKLTVFAAGGKEKLQIIFDFDKTLSKYKDEKGQLVKSTHDVFSSIETVPKTYREQSARLYSMYGPIETDPTIPIEDKQPFMNQWVGEYGDLVNGIVLNNSLIEQAVRKTNLVLRDGSKEVMTLLNENSIPALIFSAGIGDVIRAALRVHNITMPNVHVVSNFFAYENGRITGFKGKYIHAFNKNQKILEEIDFKYSKDLSDRSNVIVVGDSLGDALMSDGLPHTSNILKIAFLNNKINENMIYYKKEFDIVIAQDESMKILNSLLQRILNHHY